MASASDGSVASKLRPLLFVAALHGMPSSFDSMSPSLQRLCYAALGRKGANNNLQAWCSEYWPRTLSLYEEYVRSVCGASNADALAVLSGISSRPAVKVSLENLSGVANIGRTGWQAAFLAIIDGRTVDEAEQFHRFLAANSLTFLAKGTASTECSLYMPFPLIENGALVFLNSFSSF
jgi:hypothetical protein